VKCVLHLCFAYPSWARVTRMSLENNPNLLPDASLGRRLLALVIDWTMCRLIAALLSPSVIPDNTFSTLIIFFLEVCLFTITFQASAGQRIMAIKVVTYPDQRRVRPTKVILRTVLICLVLPAVFTKDGRALHDHFANSQTVRERY
jgi:uncharacterized RDD family membrane protein YckC